MPGIEDTLHLGWKKHQAGDVRGGESLYRQVLRESPANENAWCFLGMACYDQGRYDESFEAYREALRLRPAFPVALSNLGNTLKALGRLEEAEASCRDALRYKPDYSTAYNNLGVVLVAQGRLRDAAASFERALQVMSNDAVAHTNLGAVLVRQGRFDEGIASTQQALSLNPHYAEARKNHAIVSLLQGKFEGAWAEYEWRWRCPGSTLPCLAQPRWSGEPLAGRTILLHWEQGLGDTIQFLRYAGLLKARGARVVVCCQKPLFQLLEHCDGIDELVRDGDRLPDYDLWTPLLSIPGVLGTTLETIPGQCGYLAADPALVTHWEKRLGAFPGFRIAIVWQGSQTFHADRQRSIPLKCFSTLAQLPGVRLISLQRGAGCEQIEQLRGEFEVIDFGNELDSDHGPFMDTAAILRTVDLSIGCDTSVSHLAGALGVPAWLALSLSPDWRWLLGREDSPWYPSVRLFRQQTLGDWQDVFQRLAGAIAARLFEDRRCETPSASSPRTRERLSSEKPHGWPVDGFNCLVRARHGAMLFNRNDIYIGRSIELYGEFSEDEVVLFSRLVRAGDTVLEAGANIGAHTVPLANLVGRQGTVFAFEPQRLVFQTLCANVALNSLTNVHCRQEALGAEPGAIMVPYLDANATTNFGGLGLGSYARGDRVPLVTIDSLNLTACRLIKIDVEGMEQAALRGATETIARYQPILYVENDREDKSASLIEYIQSFGYRLFWHTPPLYREDNFFGNRQNVFQHIVSVNMLCLPHGCRFTPDTLRPIERPASRWNSREGSL